MNALQEILNPGWVGTSIGILGVLLALYFGLKGRHQGSLAYQVRSMRLVSRRSTAAHNFSGLRVLYGNEEVPQVTLTHFVLWNSGNTTLRRSDIVESDWLRIEFSPACRVLDVQISARTREVNKFQACRSSGSLHKIELDFDFLDARDGARIEVLHTGDLAFPKLAGVLRGMPAGPTNLGVFREFPFPYTGQPEAVRRSMRVGYILGRVMLVPATVVSLLFCFVGVFPEQAVSILPSLNEPFLGQTGAQGLLAGIGVAYLLPLLFVWKLRRKFPRELAASTVAVQDTVAPARDVSP